MRRLVAGSVVGKGSGSTGSLNDIATGTLFGSRKIQSGLMGQESLLCEELATVCRFRWMMLCFQSQIKKEVK